MRRDRLFATIHGSPWVSRRCYLRGGRIGVFVIGHCREPSTDPAMMREAAAAVTGSRLPALRFLPGRRGQRRYRSGRNCDSRRRVRRSALGLLRAAVAATGPMGYSRPQKPSRLRRRVAGPDCTSAAVEVERITDSRIRYLLDTNPGGFTRISLKGDGLTGENVLVNRDPGIPPNMSD